MARDNTLEARNLFFWGQDRWGAWPMWLIGGIMKSLNFKINYDNYYLFQFLFIFLCILYYVYKNFTEHRMLFISILLCIFSLKTETCNYLLDISQPYAWQLGCYLLFISIYLEKKRKSLFQYSILILLSILQVWSNPLSLFYMSIFALVIHIEKLFYQKKKLGNLNLFIFLFILPSFMINELFKSKWYIWTLLKLKNIFNTKIQVENFETSFINLKTILYKTFSNQFILLLIILIAILLLFLFFKRIRIKDKNPILITLIFLLICFIQIILFSIINWIRLNVYHERYFFPIYFLITLSFLHLVYSLLLDSNEKIKKFIIYAPLLMILPLVENLNLIPNKENQLLKEQAIYLEKNFTGLPLLGDFWGIYVWPALQEKNASIPINTTNQKQYSGWNYSKLKNGDQILVSWYLFEPKLESGSLFDLAKNPRKNFIEQGFEFSLLEEKTLELKKEGIPMAVYRIKKLGISF
jgi:hypothetical protein